VAARGALFALILGCAAMDAPVSPPDLPFIAQTGVAMKKMMKAMSVRPTGDVDKDFVDMMVAQHEGAIEMSEAVLRYGHNEQLQRIAQEIIVTQHEEIAAMRIAVGESPPPYVPAPGHALDGH